MGRNEFFASEGEKREIFSIFDEPVAVWGDLFNKKQGQKADGEFKGKIPADRRSERFCEGGYGLTGKDIDVHWIDGLRHKKPEALTMVVQTYGPVLIRAAWLYLADVHAAEDAVQETFLAAWDGAKRTREGTSLRAWLLGILVNRCRKHIRTAQRRRKREQRFLERNHENPISNSPDPRQETLQNALLRLDGAFREVVILRFWQKLSVQETAEALGVAEGTVKSRTHTAIGRLREIMEMNA